MHRLLILLLLLAPLVAGAQSQPKTFSGFVGVILDLIQQLVVGIFALTLLVFIWGVVKAWIIHGGDEKAIEEGKKIVTASIIALVVMSGVWGIVAMLRSGFFNL